MVLRAGVIIVYIMPPLMALRLLGHRLPRSTKVVYGALVVTGVVMGISATVVTIMDFVEDKRQGRHAS